MLFKPFWPVVEYVVNYDYIVNVLCENKDKPEMHCDGKCYLAKLLAEESEQSDKNPFGKKQQSSEIQNIVFLQSILDFKLMLEFIETDSKIFKDITLLHSKLFSKDISDPPELV